MTASENTTFQLLSEVNGWEGITSWLSKLYLLKGIPFQYLVPNSKALPKESIKYFYLDQNWLNAVIDGAFSIGRFATNSPDNLGDQLEQMAYGKGSNTLRPTIWANANEQHYAQMKQPLPSYYKSDALATATSEDDIVLTGFLLRSQAVADFKHMHINGYDQTNANDQLPIVRLDILSSEVMLGIFVGTLYQLNFHEPSEGLHFGFAPDSTATTYTLNLRERDGTQSDASDSKLSVDATDTTVFRQPPATGNYQPSGRVINMKNLSSAMLNKLHGSGDPAATLGYSTATKYEQEIGKVKTNTKVSVDSLNSADFALQFSAGAQQVSFVFDPTT